MKDLNKVKRASSALKIEVESGVRALEQDILDPSDSAREVWQAAQSTYEHVLSSSAKKKSFFAKQAFFEEGKKLDVCGQE